MIRSSPDITPKNYDENILNENNESHINGFSESNYTNINNYDKSNNMKMCNNIDNTFIKKNNNEITDNNVIYEKNIHNNIMLNDKIILSPLVSLPNSSSRHELNMVFYPLFKNLVVYNMLIIGRRKNQICQHSIYGIRLQSS